MFSFSQSIYEAECTCLNLLNSSLLDLLEESNYSTNSIGVSFWSRIGSILESSYTVYVLLIESTVSPIPQSAVSTMYIYCRPELFMRHYTSTLIFTYVQYNPIIGQFQSGIRSDAVGGIITGMFIQHPTYISIHHIPISPKFGRDPPPNDRFYFIRYVLKRQI